MAAKPQTQIEAKRRAARQHQNKVTTNKRLSERRTNPIVRIAPGKDGVSIWSEYLFGGSERSRLRSFLAAVFSVPEVTAIEILQSEGFGRIRFESSPEAPNIWRKVAQALRLSGRPNAKGHIQGEQRGDAAGLHVDSVFLDWPDHRRFVIHRFGSELSTWHLRHRGDGLLRLTHPVLHYRRDLAYRLEGALTAVAGVIAVTTSIFTSGVEVRFSPTTLDENLLIRQLERCWPQVFEEVIAPPSAERFVIAGGLLGLAFAGQYFVPRLRPVAVLGVGLYGAHNVVKAGEQLINREIGLSALYSLGLAFMIWTGLPFSSAVAAVFTQLWPQLAYRSLIDGQRRLFAAHRKRPASARVLRDDGSDVQVGIDAIAAGDRVVVRKGEVIPVDGIVLAGLAAVDEECLTGSVGAIDKIPGDTVFASTFVGDGTLTIEVDKIGAYSVAGHIATHLPHGTIDGLPSASEADRIATRNAQAALTISVLNLVGRRLLRPSQAAIRPDYVTGPRLSAQLAALQDLGDGINHGVFFRDRAALDKLPASDVYVFDETAAVDRQPVQVADVLPIGPVSAELLLSYATAAFVASQSERAEALASRSVQGGVAVPEISQRLRRAGAICYRDQDGIQIEVAEPAYLTAAGKPIPQSVAKVAAVHEESSARSDVSLRPLWIVRDGELLGVVTFCREGPPQATGVIRALKARGSSADLVYLSSAPQSTAEERAHAIGISNVSGDLDGLARANALAKFGRRAMWIGDGTILDARPSIEVSNVSVSVAGAATAVSDAADIVLLQPGLWGLVPLEIIGRSHSARLAADYKVVYAANLTAVAGGFFAGFGGLEAGLISNLGTGVVYVRRLRQLRKLVRRTEQRRDAVPLTQ